MTNTEALREAVATSGLKYKYLADALKITYFTLQKKIENRSEFKASEIEMLSRILGLPEKDRTKIFFAHRGDEKVTSNS